MADEISADEVAASVAELQALLLSSETVEEFLNETAALAAAKVGEGMSCGITLWSDGRPQTVASTDALATQVDEVQYGLDQGPCIHALRFGERVHIPDLQDDQRWADYAVRAVAHGVRSALSFPLHNNGETLGALNLYAQRARAFDEAAVRRAELFAQNASGALSIAFRLTRQVAMTKQLQAALASRAVIDQAIGVLVAQRRIPSAEAFEILRTASQNRNVKLRVLAAQIVQSTGGGPPRLPSFDPPR
ncbi:GAF and ANTAR domain-containing protein [Spirillospora sp. NPDC127200]